MAPTTNARQAAVWNGAHGRGWAAHHRRLDRMAAPANEHLFAAAAIGRTDRVLDIGCGTGHTTRVAARHTVEGHAVGIDVSAPMLELARRLAADEAIGNIAFEQGDAQVHPLPRGHFGVAISRAGVMFFDDPVAAFGNIRRSLAPNGRLAFLCHPDGDEQMGAVMAALTQHLPALDLHSQLPGVADFTDPDHVRGVLDRAGFTAVTLSPVEYLSELGQTATDAANFLVDVQLAGFLSGAEHTAVDRARTALATALRPHENAGAVRFRAAAWVVTARAA